MFTINLLQQALEEQNLILPFSQSLPKNKRLKDFTHTRCLQMFSNPKEPLKRTSWHSTIKLPPLIVSLSWTSSQDMKNEVLYCAPNPRKLCPDYTQSCHDFMLVHGTLLTLSTKLCHKISPLRATKIIPQFYQSYHNFFLTFNHQIWNNIFSTGWVGTMGTCCLGKHFLF